MYVFLSPHFDDVAFSCGGLVSRLAAEGRPVLIFTVMAGVPVVEVNTCFTAELHARWGTGITAAEAVQARRAEDSEAGRALGAEVVFGDVPDCIYRTAAGVPLYQDREAIFGEIHPADPATPEGIAAMVRARLGRPPTALYAPLGVGNHVDHQLVRAAGRLLADDAPEHPTYFYEEYPYMREGRAAATRALQTFNQPLLRVKSPLREREIAAKIAASAAYRSQIGSFWADEAALEADLRAYTAAVGGEAVWRLIRLDGEPGAP